MSERPTLTGQQVGSYVIETSLGAGGMGTVYRALDTKLNRRVAVKFLADGLVDAAARRRFQREAQTASSLNHPHILTVFDADEVDGRQYLVTEYIDGVALPLKSYIPVYQQMERYDFNSRGTTYALQVESWDGATIREIAIVAEEKEYN